PRLYTGRAPARLAPLSLHDALPICNIVAEAGLSFLGLGAQSPTISWGAMLADGQTFLATAPWVAVFPGLALLLAVLGVNLLGDGDRKSTCLNSSHLGTSYAVFCLKK